jgi:hypothetical protein
MAQTMWRVVYETKEGPKAVRVFATLATDAWAAVQTAYPTSGGGKHNGAQAMVTVQQTLGGGEILVGS